MLQELAPLAESPAAYAFAVLLGLLWGSFANVCIYRWPPTDEFPRGRSVVAPGSHCFACKAPVRWYDNVPLVSYLWLRGRCRDCKATFSARYLFVEALLGALFGLAWWAFVVAPRDYMPFDDRVIHFAIAAGFCFAMVVIAFIDLDHTLVLDKVAIPTAVLAYGATFLLPERRWFDGLLGAGIGYGLPWLVGVLYKLLRGREGMGLGDSTLLAAVGALLGWQGVVCALFGGSLVGAVIGVTAQLAGRGVGHADEHLRQDAEEAGEELPEDDGMLGAAMPFGPFLAIGALFYLFAEPWITLRFHM
ncbi:MAG TPA: prepilin peptidase [Kofleriaceae bacterium]